MTRRLLTLALALWSTAAWAHDPRSAAVEVEVSGSLVTVHVAVTQAGLHHALESAAGHSVDAQADGYQALVADHLRRTLRLTADGVPLAVGDVGVRLGSHQSDARLITTLPDGARQLAVMVESFDGVPDQQTVVRIWHGAEMTRGVLSDADGWTVSVPLVLPEPLSESPTASASGAPRAVGLVLAGLLALPLLVAAADGRRRRDGLTRSLSTTDSHAVSLPSRTLHAPRGPSRRAAGPLPLRVFVVARRHP